MVEHRETLPTRRTLYYKGIKVLIPAQIVVKANGPELNVRNIDDKKNPAELQ